MSSPQRFRKKPVEIEAMHFATVRDGSLIAKWSGGSNEVSPEQVQIATLEGTMTATLGDYVIRGVQGEFYPCKSDIFALTYDEVHLASAAPVEDRRGPSSLFAPRVHALAAAILASPRALDEGRIEMLPTLGFGTSVKLTLGAHLDDEELRGCDL